VSDSADYMEELRRLAREAFADELDERVRLRVDGETATVTFGDDRMVSVPLAQVLVQGGAMWVAVPQHVWAEFPTSRVTVQAVHPDPTPEVMALALSSIPHEMVTAMMAKESQIGSAEDSMGLIALRALCGILRGDKPGDYPPAAETLE
jgi:hypothetical protein